MEDDILIKIRMINLLLHKIWDYDMVRLLKMNIHNRLLGAPAG